MEKYFQIVRLENTFTLMISTHMFYKQHLQLFALADVSKREEIAPLGSSLRSMQLGRDIKNFRSMHVVLRRRLCCQGNFIISNSMIIS